MPPPEILRRCAVCGAASRPGALFCPQCGNTTSGTRTAPDSGINDVPDDQGGWELDARLKTQKLDSQDPTLKTRKLDAPNAKERRRSARAQSRRLNSESVESRNQLKQTLDTLKSALQSTLTQKAALLQQGKEDEAAQLDGQIETQKQALEAAVKKIMSSAPPVSDAEASTEAASESAVSYVDVAGTDFQPQPDSALNADVLTALPTEVNADRTAPLAGKLRDVSTVFEGATYDPSVRFVLVAAVLFVLFLVILLLSKIIT